MFRVFRDAACVLDTTEMQIEFRRRRALHVFFFEFWRKEFAGQIGLWFRVCVVVLCVVSRWCLSA